MEVKPTKIKLNNGSASGMYMLLGVNEHKLTSKGETQPPNRIYKIEIAVEATYNNKRCRGKKTFNIPKGTSLAKAVSTLLGERELMKETLRTKGTLKTKKVKVINAKAVDRTFSSTYDSWINTKSINSSASTIKTYNGCYKTHLKPLYKKLIDDITEDDIQRIVNDMINKNRSAPTISTVKIVLKQLLEVNDVMLNWKKIVLPRNDNSRSFKGDDIQAKLISKTLLEYKHPTARAVFAFLLSGRRIGETLLMEHKHINKAQGTFTLPREITKTKTEVTYQLTPMLINAINSQKTTKGLVFDLKRDAMNYHFKKAMRSIGIYDMRMHDLRSMVATVALRNGADMYSVSKMLSHKLMSTTEKSYLGSGVEKSIEAQETFQSLICDTVIDVEVVIDEFTELKKIYPNATDEKIYKIIKMMGNRECNNL